MRGRSLPSAPALRWPPSPGPAVYLLHADGALPNVALMKLAAYFRGRGLRVELIRKPWAREVWHTNLRGNVYGSSIFSFTAPKRAEIERSWGDVRWGGTGVDVASSLEAVDPTVDWDLAPLDYSVYPYFRPSIGFTQRGCRLSCPFCVVPAKEGKPRLYTAWDNLGDERRVLDGVGALAAAGVPPEHLLVYMLVGYAHGETWADVFRRFATLANLGCRPYPMPYDRAARQDLAAFQKWATMGFYRFVPWHEFEDGRLAGVDRPAAFDALLDRSRYSGAREPDGPAPAEDGAAA